MGKRILFISCGKVKGNTWQAAQVAAQSAGNAGAESLLIEAGRLEGIGRGCIGCMKCTKACPTNAISVSNNLATIDQDLCIACMQCADECPVKAIQLPNLRIYK